MTKFSSLSSELIIPLHFVNAKINKDLYRDIVHFYQANSNMSLLESKVYAYLLMDFERRGVCFDEFLNLFKCSKSSLSATLRSLLDSNKIEFYNKIDSRKRYFRLNDEFLQTRIRELLKLLQEEGRMVSAIMDDQQKNEVKNQRTVTNIKIYARHLNNSIENTSSLLDSITK